MRQTPTPRQQLSPRPDRTDFRPREWAIVQRLRTPRQVQRFLRALPYNWEARGETLRTFRGVVRHWQAHCLEAALTAATILEQHGYPPLLLDFESQDKLDHVIFLFRDKGRWVVFVERGGRARVAPVEMGHENGLEAEILKGLSAGERVVLHPSDRVTGGQRIEARKLR